MSYALRARPAPTRTSSATKSRRSNSETPSSPASAQSTPEDDWKDPAPRSSPERKRKESTAKGEDKPPVEKRAKVEMTVQLPATTAGPSINPDFVPLATPTLDQICFSLSDILRGMRLEATNDNNLQQSSQAHIDVSILHLPTHAHRTALCLTLNRYSAFCASTAVDIAAFPLTATKVAIFLARSANTETGRRLLQLLPQPNTFKLPILAREEALSRGSRSGESALGPDEGNLVAMELVRSWTEALAYAEGSTKAVWGPLLRLAGGGSLLQDNVIHELLGSFETEAALYQRRRRAATERGGEMRDAAVSTAMVRSGDEISASSLSARQASLPDNSLTDWRNAQQQPRSNQSGVGSRPPSQSSQARPSANQQQESFARPQAPQQSTSTDPRSSATVHPSPFSRPHESALTSRPPPSGLPYATPRTLPEYDLSVRQLPPMSLPTTFQRTTSDPQDFILGEGHGLESNEGMRTQSRNQGGGGRGEAGGDGAKLSQLAMVASLGENANVDQAPLESSGTFSIDDQHAHGGSGAYQQAESTFPDPQAGWSSSFDSSNQLDTSSQSFYASSIPSSTQRQAYGSHSRQPLSIVPPTNYGNPDSNNQFNTDSPRGSRGGINRAAESPRSTISPGMPMANEEYFLSQLSGMSYDQRGQPTYMHPPARRSSMMGPSDGRGGGRNQYGDNTNYQESQFDNSPRSSYLSHSTNYPPPASPALRPSTGTTAYPPTPATTEFGYPENISPGRFGPSSFATPSHQHQHQQQQQQQYQSSNQQASQSQQFHQSTSFGGSMIPPGQSYYQQSQPSSSDRHEGGLGDPTGGYGGGAMGGGYGGFHSGQRSFSLPVSSTGRSYPSQQLPTHQPPLQQQQPQQQQQQQQNRYPPTQLSDNPLDYSQLSSHVGMDTPLLPVHPLDVNSTTPNYPAGSTSALEKDSVEKLATAQGMSEEVGLDGLGIALGLSGGEGKNGKGNGSSTQLGESMGEGGENGAL